MEIIKSAPSRIDWNRFPYIEYLLAWQVSDSDSTRIGGNFEVFWSSEKWTLWRRKR